MRAPRMADIAKHASVSEATVSRVLNGKRGVAEETRRQVLAAVDVLGYDRPVKLWGASEGLIGLVVPELSNPVFPGFAQAIENALAARHFMPLLCTQTPGGVSEDEYVEMMCERGVAGIIFVSGLHADATADLDRYQRLRDKGLPLVLVNGFRMGVDAAFLSTDEVGGMVEAVAHLVDLGHRRIGLAIGPTRFVPARRAITGFRAAMADLAGVDDITDLVATTWYTVEGGAEAAQVLLARGCTAIVCGSDIMAVGAIESARGQGFRVPEDVSVIGHDDSLLMAYTDPPLTTLAQDYEAIGQAAVSLLLDEIAGRPAARAEMTFRRPLTVRASTGPARSRAGSKPQPGRG